MNRRVPNGTHGGVRGRKSPLETLSYSIFADAQPFNDRVVHSVIIDSLSISVSGEADTDE